MNRFKRGFRIVAMAFICGMIPAVANAHKTDTTPSISFSPLASVPVGTMVTITGKVVTTGQSAVTSPPAQAHPEVAADLPVTEGTIKIQQCIDGGVAAPTEACVTGSGVWTDSLATTGEPNASGEFEVNFDTTGLGGMTIGFRTHYNHPTGGPHGFGTSQSEGRDLTITQVGALAVPVDIKPQSCPNPINVNAKGVLPVAILGTSSFDVNDIDVNTVRLEGVAPLRSAVEDVATPFVPFTGKLDALDCTQDGADGYPDLTLKFDLQAVVSNLGTVNDGDVIVLFLTGKLNDGTDIEGEDIVQILKKK